MRATTAKAPLERDVQDQIVQVLRIIKGIHVYQTSIRKGAGRDGRGGGGQDKGIPDLIVSIDGHHGWYVGIEIKRPGAVRWSSPEQREAYERHEFHVAQCPFDALAAIVRATADLDERIYNQAHTLMGKFQTGRAA